MFSNTYIPYRGYYTSPFSRYGKSFKDINSIELSSYTSKSWFEKNCINQKDVDFVLYGTSVHQHRGFWAGPWAAAMLGADHTTGSMISQACTTGATAIYQAAANIELGLCKSTYCLVSDRVSNGPIVNWPNYEKTENWVNDNFEFDPWGQTSMLETAELLSKKFKITKDEIDEITLCRHDQYYNIKEKPYMFETNGICDDEGVRNISIERLKKLKPASSGGIHSIGNLTFAADGHCGMLVTNLDTALSFSNITIKILSYGFSRSEKSLMPYASIDSSKMALQKANLSIQQINVINQHNAFAVNDIVLAKELNIDSYKMNSYGSPLVYGHPQSPVLVRLTIEAIEECVNRGGGRALITGAAGGDTGASLIIEVS
jgi:acetyl-CoA acetyltransferase